MARIRDLMGTGNAALAARAIAGTQGAITAAGSSSQANATLLSYETNFVTTASGADSVKLPTAAQGSQPGDMCFVFNNTSTSCNCYPGGSESANGSTSAISIAQNKMLIAKRVNATNWGYTITA